MTANTDVAEAPVSADLRLVDNTNNQNNTQYLNNSNSNNNRPTNSGIDNGAASQDLFQIAAKAEKLLQEILASNNNSQKSRVEVKQEPVAVKQEPAAPPLPTFVPQQQAPTARLPTQPASSYFQPSLNFAYQLPQHATAMFQPQPQAVLLAGPNYYTHPHLHPQLYYQIPQPVQFYPTHFSQFPARFQHPRPPTDVRHGYAPSYTFTSIRPGTSSGSHAAKRKLAAAADDAEADEQDLNVMRERELSELKCKSVVEKMAVFVKYYDQFGTAYAARVEQIAVANRCTDALLLRFRSLVGSLDEYGRLVGELAAMVGEHEGRRDPVCKNNHRKTKKFFNKTKAFVRYECAKRLQTSVFEYRRLIGAADRYAGMYDLLDMNNYLVSLLPDLGVAIRRYINRCERAKEIEMEDEADEECNYSENSNDSATDEATATTAANAASSSAEFDLTIPTFKEFVASHHANEEDTVEEPAVSSSGNERKEANSSQHRVYESYSKGIDALNGYLLKRVDDEETVDELVKERIVKWINKRQSKYILIFSEVDKLLAQHAAGECYAKFHSYLLFNLGKLVTVCDSYHQKLKELLYSTTIRRKKKRKKVKLVPEAMTDVFDEIAELKRALEHGKVAIRRCNIEHKNATASAASAAGKEAEKTY